MKKRVDRMAKIDENISVAKKLKRKGHFYCGEECA